MSWVKIWVHLVFCTKYRTPFLNTQELRKEVFNHIKENADKKDIWLDCVNGHSEHAHCLVALGREQSISKIAQLIKGESSFWINQNKLTEKKFVWQDDYWAIGVSEYGLSRVRKYIYNQESHHSKMTFDREIDLLEKKYGWGRYSTVG